MPESYSAMIPGWDRAAVERLVEKYRQRAEAVADSLPQDELRRLFYYLVDTVLDRPAEEAAPGLQIISPAALTAAS